MYTRSLFRHQLLRPFNGPKPGGSESTIRKWKRELEGGEREKERKKERKTQIPKLWRSKGNLLSEMQAYISLVRWLLRYYTGWNFINSHNMDSLIHTRLLQQKRATEGSYWKGSKQIPFPKISVLRTVCCFTRSHCLELTRSRGFMRTRRQHAGILLLNAPWQAKWNKPDTKGQILYDSTYMRYLY